MIDLSSYLKSIQFRKRNSVVEIFCIIRKKWLINTPEEVVRQTALSHLVYLGYGSGLISVEKTLTFNTMQRRYDIAVFNKGGSPTLIVECKEPKTPITQKVLEQISIYNLVTQCEHIWITNGHNHLIYQINVEDKTYQKVDSLPLP